MSDRHVPSDIDAQAAAFVACFSPDGAMLDRRFGWLSDAQRAALGERAEAKLREAYIETVAAAYGGEEDV
jgi:hypothetical protein